MAYILPFRAWRYDPQKGPLAQVVTQPYDKISAEMQARYYAASPYNLVRIILGKRTDSDHRADNVYTRAAECFADWRRNGTLRQDPQPAVYAYSQSFLPPGGKAPLTRTGFISMGRLEDYSAGVVFRHEQTLPKPKADRLDLLRATRAHFGQLFMLYEDSGEIEALLSPPAPSEIELTDEYGVVHTLRAISDPQTVRKISENMADKRLIIADGHHRYETALNYRNERRAMTGPGPAQDQPYDFAMMTFVNMASPGLVILPTHRVVHGLTSFSADQLRSGVRSIFNVESVDTSIDAARATAILNQAGYAGTAFLAVTRSSILLLHTSRAFGSPCMTGLSFRQQSLDVVQLHRCILEGALGLSPESILQQQNLSYVRNVGEALAQVREGQADVALLMNPVSIKQVRDIAFAGEVLPQKSTDFYPKLLSGLTIYALD
jgi:uncharacterized protein (DUF1015 family)